MNDLSDRIANLSPQKRALLEKRLRGEWIGPTPSELQIIPRRPERGPSPLSFAQLRLRLLDQLQRRGPSYNINYAYRFTGELKFTLWGG